MKREAGSEKQEARSGEMLLACFPLPLYFILQCMK